jgi:hypothetical protein
MLDMELILNAINKCLRSPVLDDLAVARTARASVSISRAIARSPDALREDADTIVSKLWSRAAGAIAAGKYADAYGILDDVPGQLRDFRDRKER